MWGAFGQCHKPVAIAGCNLSTSNDTSSGNFTIANMAACARKRGFSVATVAKGKTRYPFLCASASCLQFFEAFFFKIFPRHTYEYGKNCSSVMFKILRRHLEVSRLIPFCLRSLLLCRCSYTGAIANREVLC